MNNTESDNKTSKYGIPQGTVLGPMLFLIYANDLFDLGTQSVIISFADDTVMLSRGRSWDEVVETANRDLKIMKTWFDYNLLTLNAQKTVIVPFSIKDKKNIQDLSFKIHHQECLQTKDCSNEKCTPLKTDKIVKYLGILIDSQMKWKDHINKTIERLQKIYYIFYRLRNFLKNDVMKTVYYALGQSIMQYGIVGWGGAYSSNLEPLYIVQRKIIKIILHKPSDYPTDLLHEEFCVPRITALYKKYAIKQTYKDYNVLSQDDVQPNTNIRENPRLGKCIKLPKKNTSFGQNHYTYWGVKWFNDLPRSIRSSNEEQKFLAYVNNKIS